MDQDQQASAKRQNNPDMNETSQRGESPQSSASPPTAKRQKLTEADSDDQIMAGIGKAFPRQQWSEKKRCLPLEAPTRVMPNTSDCQECLGQLEGPGEGSVEQSREDGQDDDAFSDLRRKVYLSRTPFSSAPEVTIDPYGDLIEQAVEHGHRVTAQAASQGPRLVMGGGKWQSTLVTLTVEGKAGAACHQFNSDLWRYGGSASLLRSPDWHEVDSIELKVRHEQIEVSLHEAQTRLSNTWSWSSNKDGIFCAQPEHFHIAEMVCGYLNLAAGHAVSEDVRGLFEFPLSSFGIPSFETRSHRRESRRTSFSILDSIRPPDVVDALTRVHSTPMEMPEVAEKPHNKDDLSVATGSETFLIESHFVRLPSMWSACGGSPCVCGDSVMVLDTTQDPLEVRELASGEHYLAISYVWAQHDQCSLASYIGRATEATGVHLVWVDRLCINQRCGQHKARQIPRMREVYQKGYATVALVPDITESLPTIFHTPTAIVPEANLSVAKPFIAQMKHCAWRTRCWTWQEGLLGGRGYYVTQKQVLPARIVSDAMVPMWDDRRSVSIGTELMDSLGERSLRCRITTWGQEISTGDLLDAEDHELMKYWLMPQVKSLGTALRITRFRTALRPEDEIYSVLGMVLGGQDVQVVYGESRNAILRRAVNLRLLGAEILHSESVSSRDGESWAAKDDTSRHIGQIYDLGQRIDGRAQIGDRGLKSQFYRLEGNNMAHTTRNGDSFYLQLKNSENFEEKVAYAPYSGREKLSTLLDLVDQVLLLLEDGERMFRAGLLVSGIGANVVRLATVYILIDRSDKLEAELVWRIVG